MALGFRPVCHMATRRAATNVLPECGGWRGVGHRPECPPLTRRTHDTSRTTEVFAAFVTSGVGVLAAFVTWPRGALLPTCCWNVKAGEVGASSGLPTTDSQTTQPVSHSDRSRSVHVSAVAPRAQFSPPTSSVAAPAPPCTPHAIRYGSAPFERTRDRPCSPLPRRETLILPSPHPDPSAASLPLPLRTTFT